MWRPFGIAKSSLCKNAARIEGEEVRNGRNMRNLENKRSIRLLTTILPR